MIRVAVTGGREFQDYSRVLVEMGRVIFERGAISCLIQGDARGADRLAKQFALRAGIPVESYPADWDKYGKAAGHIRNRRMLEEGKPDLLVAFPGGRGTANCVRTARELGIEVLEVKP